MKNTGRAEETKRSSEVVCAEGRRGVRVEEAEEACMERLGGGGTEGGVVGVQKAK
jgi:hypothetical protein